MPELPDSLAAFIERGEVRDRSLAVVNRTRPQPIQDMLEATFGHASVGITELDLPDAEDDAVVLLEDDDVVASSPLSALENEVLMVNSDLYITGTKSLGDVSLPDVLAELEETRFRVRGYPASNSEKLPLILISRYIEQLAWNHKSGRLRSSFQRLSRLNDERGTRNVYRQLGETAVNVHVYGVPDWIPPQSFPGVIHAGYDGEFRSSWFVVHDPEADDARPAALVAERVAENEWDALWTFRPERVKAVNRYIERSL